MAVVRPPLGRLDRAPARAGVPVRLPPAALGRGPGGGVLLRPVDVVALPEPAPGLPGARAGPHRGVRPRAGLQPLRRARPLGGPSATAVHGVLVPQLLQVPPVSAVPVDGARPDIPVAGPV